jgi:sigma-B regulation protein RsbU (phosphoserine phosphatase)
MKHVKAKIFTILNHSVAVRTTCIVLVVVTVIMLTAGIWQMTYVRGEVVKEVNRQAGRSMENAINVIDNRLSNVETALNTAASYAYMFAPHEALCSTLMQRLIEANDDISAVTLLYEANFFKNHGRYFAPTVYRTTDNKIETDEIGGPENDFCYLETDSNWVYTNKLDKGYWCLPYVDSMSTKRAMVTYSVPLHDNNGHTYAVLCADVSLDWVQNLCDQAKPYSYSTVFVVGRDSQYVCHPDQSWIQSINVIEQAHRQNDSTFFGMTKKMLTWQRGADTVDMSGLLQSDNSKQDFSSSIVFYAPVDRVQWSVCFTIPQDKIMEAPNRLRTNMLLLLVVLLGAVFASLYYIIRSQLSPLQLLSNKAHEISQGNFDVCLPEFKSKDEIRRLRDAFDDMQHSLAKYIEELQSTTASKASIESELRVASNIQMSMLPKIFPPYPDRNDIDIYGELTPAKSVGGDLFDFYIRDEKLFFCIGDVSGKGVPASLVMAVTRAQFRTVSAHEATPDRIVTTINDAMAEGNDSLMFVTLLVGVLDLPTGRLRYCNAGHDAPLLVRYNNTIQVSTLPCDSNIPVGVMPGWKYNTQEAIIKPFTTIFLFTDGLTEAENCDHKQFGMNRVMAQVNSIQAQGSCAPHAIIEQMKQAVHAFVGDAEQSDDLTMLAVQYTKQQLDVRYQNHLTLPNDVQTVPQLSAFVDEVCETAGYDMSTTLKINLAIEEAVVNVMNYAYPNGVKGNVDIDAQINDVRLKFVISDSGTPFDPTAKAEVDTTLSAEERGIGGLGIHLIRQIMDTINYERVDGKNVLTLRKNLTK